MDGAGVTGAAVLCDPDSAFLELSTLAAWGSDFEVGANMVSGVVVVEGVECLITANEPTARGGAVNPWTMQKGFRAPRSRTRSGCSRSG